jgi:hypothetical protein
MIWVKEYHELPNWEIILIELEVEVCYAERATRRMQQIGEEN